MEQEPVTCYSMEWIQYIRYLSINLVSINQSVNKPDHIIIM